MRCGQVFLATTINYIFVFIMRIYNNIVFYYRQFFILLFFLFTFSKDIGEQARPGGH